MTRGGAWPPAPPPLPVAIADNHAHLEWPAGDQPKTVRERINDAAAAGIDRIVQIGCELDSAQWTATAVEDYPELKADGNFRRLHGDLVQIEDDLQYARRYYNGTVRVHNTRIQQFPAAVLADSHPGEQTHELQRRLTVDGDAERSGGSPQQGAAFTAPHRHCRFDPISRPNNRAFAVAV